MPEEFFKVVDERGCPLCGEKHTLEEHINEIERRSNLESMWVVIPWSILTAKQLTSTEKLIYGEISALQRRDGYCRASNEYLGAAIGVHPNSVSRIIRKLRKMEILTIDFEDCNGKTKRRIYLLPLTGKLKGFNRYVKPPLTSTLTKRIEKENRNRNSKGLKKCKEIVDKLKGIPVIKSFPQGETC